MTDNLTVRPATQADVEAYYGEPAPRTIRAKVLERDGEILGVAGYYIEAGTVVVFSDNRDGIPKMRIWREAVKFMRDFNLPAVCSASDASAPFLERLGWVHVADRDEERVYRWQP